MIYVRSIGNSVGTAPFRNTNRNKDKVLYTRRMNKRARALGYNNAAHLVQFFAALNPANYTEKKNVS